MTTSTKISTTQLSSGLASIGQRQYHPLLSKLQRPDLVRAQGFIDGEWVEALGNEHFIVEDPATELEVARVTSMGAEDTHTAVTAAMSAQREWKRSTPPGRAKLLREWAAAITANSQDLAIIGSVECGKPLAEAKWEVELAVGVIEYFAHEIVRSSGFLIYPSDPRQKILVSKEPVGVCGIVTPWNFPYAILGLSLGPPLAAGCAVVVKPAGETPLSMLALATLAEEVGFPAGVINVVTAPRERSEEVGRVLTSRTEVRKISFAGSTQVGKWLMRQSSESLKRLSLELSGNAAFIVFEDADLDKAVDGLINSKFSNTGQACMASNRIFVHSSVYEAFAAKVVNKVKRLKMGLPLEEGVQLGPLIGPSAVKTVAGLVEDAVAHGAKVLLGGRTSDLGKNFYEATVLLDVNESMRVWREEIYGPVIPMSSFLSEEEVVQKANATAAGLAAYFYTRDVARIFRVASELECGMVGANSELVTHVGAPYGGVKESGLGREGAAEGLQEYQETKMFSLSAALLLLGGTAFQSALAEDPAYTYKSDDSDALSPPEWAQGYPTCGGSRQSPIDITESKLCSVYQPPPGSFAGSCPDYNMTENEESYKAAVIGGNCTVTAKGETYNYAQFHVHTPSEHTIDGQAFDGEIHFVHKKADGSAALVIGLFLRKTDAADTEPAVDIIVDAMSDVTFNTSIPMTLGSYSELIGAYVEKGHVFNYAGSLTTPPCTEFVDWWVVRTPIPISSAQFDRIEANLAELEITDDGKNARPVQPLNGRTVTTSFAEQRSSRAATPLRFAAPREPVAGNAKLVRSKGFVNGERIEGCLSPAAQLARDCIADPATEEDLAHVAWMGKAEAHETIAAAAQLLVMKEPIGVCTIMSPWNFLYATAVRNLVPCVASGCAAVVKPSGKTPLSMLALAKLGEGAGVSAGVINVITVPRGSHSGIGKELSENPDVCLVAFTGPTSAGIKLVEQAASTVQYVVLELGGNSPFIVFEDTEIENALDGLIAAKFRNSGQTCVTSSRVFVYSSIYAKFTAKLVKRVKNLKLGLPLEHGVKVGLGKRLKKLPARWKTQCCAGPRFWSVYSPVT
ncbi:hypothetical protein ON010_g3296 [Phytophthora cinnamomi]|nr:hypothetical protein ON010_g3296 [Phytophthora cinnamomi]